MGIPVFIHRVGGQILWWVLSVITVRVYMQWPKLNWFSVYPPPSPHTYTLKG